MIFKPKQAECDIIKVCARIEAGMSGVTLEVGERYNLNRGHAESQINIALISSHEHWDDTDLNQTMPWKWFRKGFELAKGGRAICDFYIYNASRDELEVELQSNVVAYWEGGKLVRVRGVGDTDIWANGKWVRRSPYNIKLIEKEESGK